MDVVSNHSPSTEHKARQRAATVPFKDRVTCNIPEGCAASGLGRTKIYSAIKAGDLQTRKIGRRRLILVSSLLQWLAA